jgi:hypothetical protein
MAGKIKEIVRYIAYNKEGEQVTFTHKIDWITAIRTGMCTPGKGNIKKPETVTVQRRQSNVPAPPGKEETAEDSGVIDDDGEMAEGIEKPNTEKATAGIPESGKNVVDETDGKTKRLKRRV